jgi:hypothetical protein
LNCGVKAGGIDRAFQEFVEGVVDRGAGEVRSFCRVEGLTLGPGGEIIPENETRSLWGCGIIG